MDGSLQHSNIIIRLTFLIHVCDYFDMEASMENIQVLKLHPLARIPERATAQSTGFDLYACIESPIELKSSPQLISVGIALSVPFGIDAQIRPRSGLTLKGIISGYGTIDADYRGELFVTMYLLNDDSSYVVNSGDRIAQLVFNSVPVVDVEVVNSPDDLDSTDRSSGGHGSTGR